MIVKALCFAVPFISIAHAYKYKGKVAVNIVSCRHAAFVMSLLHQQRLFMLNA